jgi:hypothetical protein
MSGKKERGSRRASSLGRQSHLRNPWSKTMVIISDYETEYNEEKNIFDKEQ